MNEIKNPIEKYCADNSYKLAAIMEKGVGIVVKKKPWYCPMWLYKKIIKDSVEIAVNQTLFERKLL
mgnify:CR=1 FL=1